MTLITEELVRQSAAENPEPQALSVFVIDNSGSTAGAPIQAINDALPRIAEGYRGHPLAIKRSKIAIVALSEVELIVDFCSPEAFVPPVIQVFGATPTGAAMELAYTTLMDRVKLLRAEGIKTYRSNIFLMSDGGATDDITRIAARIRRADEKRLINMFAIGFSDMDLDLLRPFTHTHAPVHLDGFKFDEFFDWTTMLTIEVTNSRSATGGDQPPAGNVDMPSPKGWLKA